MVPVRGRRLCVDLLKEQRTGAVPVGKRPHRDGQPHNGDDQQQRPAQEGEIQQEELHPVPPHAQAAQTQAVRHAVFGVEDHQIAGHAVAVQRPDPREDQQQEAQGDDEPGQQHQQQNGHQAAEAVQQHTPLHLPAAARLQQHGEEAEGDHALQTGEQIAHDRLRQRRLDGGEDFLGGGIVLGHDGVGKAQHFLFGGAGEPKAEDGKNQDQRHEEGAGLQNGLFLTAQDVLSFLLDAGAIHGSRPPSTFYIVREV